VGRQKLEVAATVKDLSASIDLTASDKLRMLNVWPFDRLRDLEVGRGKTEEGSWETEVRSGKLGGRSGKTEEEPFDRLRGLEVRRLTVQ
jgi:hypothetical protein